MASERTLRYENVSVQSSTATIRRALRMPADAPASVKAIFKQVLRLPTVRSTELEELRDHYEGDHDRLVDQYIPKPPSWDPETWRYIKKDLMHINSTRTSLRTLVASVYGGQQVRRIRSDKGPFKDQLNAFVSTASWKKAMKRLLREGAHYGTSFLAPSYSKERRRFSLRHLNPITTHILTTELDPETPVVVAEFDQKRNWVRIWSREFYAVLARRDEDVEYLRWVDDFGKPIARPFFPVLICRPEPIPGSPYGLSLMRDTPKFNRSLAVSYFNVSFSAKLKAQALLTIATADNTTEVDADLTQLGPHQALILPKGAAAQFIANNADISALLDVMDRLQELEAYVLGIPALKAERNQSAESAKLVANPLTSQVSELALTMVGTETEAIHLLALVGHWEVGSPATVEDVERLYQVRVRLKPSIKVESLTERSTALTSLADRGVVPEESVVEEFNPDMTDPEIEQQAAVWRERRERQTMPSGEPREKSADPES